MDFLLDHFSPPRTSTNLLCPMVRPITDKMDRIELFKFKKLKNIRDLTLRKVHHLLPIYKTIDSFRKTNISHYCGVCVQETNDASFTDFWCFGCRATYHKECAESPPQIKVPYHPKHPLQRHSSNCNYIKCHCCGENAEGIYYSCSICDFNLHPVCAIKSNTLSINNTKRHHHPLTYFPRKNSLTCDVCALGDDKSFIYICSQCDFFVHKSCIDLPTTIKISRHDHRITFTPCLSLPYKDWYCGVCRERVDGNYGEYSCVKGCNYVVHSKCATRRDLWDGKELEGEPEIHEYRNILPFEEIGDGIIKHFSHSDHHMRLEKENDLVDGEKRCQACILPIYEGGLYNCIKCDFTLHEICAHLPRRKWHHLHAHPLTLKVYHNGKFECPACENDCFGFQYVCCEASCRFNLDVRCASVSEPFVHGLHPHPLFLTFVQEKLSRCSVCWMTRRHLTCIQCRFVLCFRCATIPYKVKYRHDEHFLTFSLNDCDILKSSSCEICEGGTITTSIGFYTCNVCSVNVHKECLLGKNPFMKQGESIVINEVTLFIIPNDRLTRPICNYCEFHIPYTIAFTTIFGLLFCSTGCINGFGEERLFDLYQRWRTKDITGRPSIISAGSSAVRRATRRIQEGIQEGIEEAEALLKIFPYMFKKN